MFLMFVLDVFHSTFDVIEYSVSRAVLFVVNYLAGA